MALNVCSPVEASAKSPAATTGVKSNLLSAICVKGQRLAGRSFARAKSQRQRPSAQLTSLEVSEAQHRELGPTGPD